MYYWLPGIIFGHTESKVQSYLEKQLKSLGAASYHLHYSREFLTSIKIYERNIVLIIELVEYSKYC